MRFGLRSGVGQRALARRADVLGIAPQRARLVVVGPRAPGVAPLGQHLLGDQQVDRSRLGVDGESVAVFDQRDRPAVGRLGADMADAEAAGRARKAPVGDQRDLSILSLVC